MIEFGLGLNLVDYLIKFLQKRDDNVDEYFERYVTPAYEAAEVVFSDYSNILTKLLEKIEYREDTIQLIKFLEAERIKYLPIRMRLRAEIKNRFSTIKKTDDLPEFERGILGILMGGLTTLEDIPQVYTPFSRHPPTHPLLFLLYNFSSDENENRPDYYYFRKITYDQINHLNMAWKDVVNGYANYKVIVVPTPSNKIFVKKVSPKSIENKINSESMPPTSITNKTINESALPKPTSKKIVYKREGD